MVGCKPQCELWLESELFAVKEAALRRGRVGNARERSTAKRQRPGIVKREMPVLSVEQAKAFLTAALPVAYAVVCKEQKMGERGFCPLDLSGQLSLFPNVEVEGILCQQAGSSGIEPARACLARSRCWHRSQLKRRIRWESRGNKRPHSLASHGCRDVVPSLDLFSGDPNVVKGSFNKANCCQRMGKLCLNKARTCAETNLGHGLCNLQIEARRAVIHAPPS